MFESKLLAEYTKKLFTNPSFAVDDFVDKAHYIGTTGLLLFFALIVGAKQMFGQPISCLIQPEYAEVSWHSYINSYCYVTSTFTRVFESDVMPWNEDVPASEKIYVSYYQWIPYMLAIQAAMFYAPHLFWQIFQSTQTDVPFGHIVGGCVAGRDAIVREKEEKIDEIVDDLAETHNFRRVKGTAMGLGCNGTIAYFAQKIMNVLNLFLQLYLFHLFVGGESFAGGMEIIWNAWKGHYWDYAGTFPHVTYCTYKQTVLGNTQKHTVQCLLMTNMVTEKVFALLIGWLSLLFVSSILNLLYVAWRHLINRENTAIRYLKGHKNKYDVDTNEYANRQLGFDGLLLLRFIESNAGFLVASTIASQLCDVLQDGYIKPDKSKLEDTSDKKKGADEDALAVHKKSDEVEEVSGENEDKEAVPEETKILSYSMA